jgi:hypothetical protein
MDKLIIPECKIPGTTNRNLCWIINHVKAELLKQGRKQAIADLMNRICNPALNDGYLSLTRYMNDLVPFDLA